MTAYADVLARLLPARRFGIVLGLGRMRELLDRLGAPDRQLGTVVHVAGTNGKGSTVAMIAALAAAGGARVATYTSPHLSTLRERIVIDGELISEAAFVAAAAEVAATGGDELTFFEQVTAIAILAIAARGVEVTVLEVGLGGRLDATNVVDAAIGVVTGVALDHEAILGSNLDAIAGEKAGIFKRGRTAIVGASGEPAAVPILIAAARAAGAIVHVIDEAAIASVPAVGLVGAHQRRNAAAALAAIDKLADLGVVRVDDSARARALANVQHPGRFEILERGASQRVILDGAHNPHGALALATALRARGERPVLIISISADKEVAAIAEALVPVVGDVITTQFQQERALDADRLARVFRQAGAAHVSSAPDLAFALTHAAAAPLVLVAGSLFLVGEARTLLLNAPTDPVRVADPSATGVR